MRVLYVAMTRARDRLIVTASVKDASGAIRSAANSIQFTSAHPILSSSNFLSWILPPLVGDGGIRGCRVITPDSGSGTGIGFTADTEKTSEPASSDDLFNLFANRFAFSYPYAHLSKIPAKLTVSRLYPEVLDEDAVNLSDGEDFAFDETPPLPDFMKSDQKSGRG